MIEVKCPLCEADVEVPDVDGHYECPECKDVFEYEGLKSKSTRSLTNFIILFFVIWGGAMILGLLGFGEWCTDDCYN